ncbi:MAG: hypothetical protein IAC51_06320 [bacterium]|uniref:Uncharacterized protein n=1 Tax=Candidatus Aphodosoma intestinipullorum TaxID=2840674 RepID=A0A940IF47_9BACT|nr:hypothetical protein [Candidatus Aphodosoma intestinipullorum]
MSRRGLAQRGTPCGLPEDTQQKGTDRREADRSLIIWKKVCEQKRFIDT